MTRLVHMSTKIPNNALEERLRWVLPIVKREIKLTDAAKVFPSGKRTLERWVANYKKGGEEGLKPKSTRPKTQPNETPIRIKEKIIEYLRNKGIDARVYYPIPLHLQGCFKYLGYKKGDFPESEKASVQTLAIPVYPDLTRAELDYIIQSIREFLR